MLRIRDRSELSAAEDANESYSNNILVKLNTTKISGKIWKTLNAKTKAYSYKINIFLFKTKSYNYKNT